MSTRPARDALAANPERLATAERLLLQYPEVSEAELDLIGDFLKNADPIDVGLLSSNKEAWLNADRFRRQHRYYFALGLRFYLYWAAAIAGIVLVLVLLKDIGHS